MAICAHRPEPGSLFIQCVSRRDNRTCVCSEEVLAEIEAAKDVARIETRVARVPDSARQEGIA